MTKCNVNSHENERKDILKSFADVCASLIEAVTDIVDNDFVFLHPQRHWPGRLWKMGAPPAAWAGASPPQTQRGRASLHQSAGQGHGEFHLSDRRGSSGPDPLTGPGQPPTSGSLMSWLSPSRQPAKRRSHSHASLGRAQMNGNLAALFTSQDEFLCDST